MKDIKIPVVGLHAQTGPGSQPPDPDGSEMMFTQMPEGMTTFHAPLIPEAEDTAGLETAIALGETLLKQLQNYRIGDQTPMIELDSLNLKNRTFFDQLLGEGEVSVQCNGNINALVQESVLAGIWRVQYVDDQKNVLRDIIEVADIPGLVSELTFSNAADHLDVTQLTPPETVYNAPPLLAEIADKLPEYHPDGQPHVINLSLLPHTEDDIAYLSDCLGIGPIIILSRGYGNCRISSTGTRNVWWVQYFNSQDTLILNTLEISKVPAVACASKEDIEDSSQRLDEILSIYR